MNLNLTNRLFLLIDEMRAIEEDMDIQDPDIEAAWMRGVMNEFDALVNHIDDVYTTVRYDIYPVKDRGLCLNRVWNVRDEDNRHAMFGMGDEIREVMFDHLPLDYARTLQAAFDRKNGKSRLSHLQFFMDSMTGCPQNIHNLENPACPIIY